MKKSNISGAKAKTEDFASLAKEVGYVKARQHLKRLAVQAHQKKIVAVDGQEMLKKAPQRLKACIELSATLGAPSLENPIDKMVEAAARKVVPKKGETQDDAEKNFAIETCMRQSLLTNELSISHMKIGSLPLNMGDTLFLQLSHLKRVNALGNCMRQFLSEKMPQTSAYHIRYAQELNLSGNELSRLCPDFGVLQCLHTLNLSQNNISELPVSMSKLDKLRVLDMSRNNVKAIPPQVADLVYVERLNLEENRISIIPSVLTKLTNLLELNLKANCFSHLAVLPPFLTADAIWHKATDEITGKVVFINVLTKERIRDVGRYKDTGQLARAAELHTFQRPATLNYRRRKIWLSINKVYEWEPVADDETGGIYYRNNVSGVSTWELPADLDILGECASLTSLDVSKNMLKGLPASFGNLCKLKCFLAVNNRMHYLPANFGGLTNLEVLNLEANELNALPETLGLCCNLLDVNVNDNHIVKLPDSIGLLPKLRKLYAAGNSLKTLPFTLGYSKTIKDVLFHENPLEDPPYEEIQRPLPNLLWYLRQRFMIEAKGAPPPMKYVYMGTAEEVMELMPEYRERIKKLVAEVPHTGVLNLQMLGLREIPKEALKLATLKELRLDMNSNLGMPRVFPAELKPIRTLSMRACGVATVPTSIAVLVRLTTLNLEDNYIESLPSSFTRMRALVDLNLAKNRLYSVPEGMASLTCLKRLILDGNNIELLPSDIGSISCLEHLDLARNRLYEITEGLCNNQKLRKLNIEGNKLIGLPRRFNELNLVELRAGYNKLEWLPNDLFEGNLGKSIAHFTCQENNMLELPISLMLVSPDIHLEADFNPLRSPPGHLMSEPLKVTQGYMRVRAARLADLSRYLEEDEFIFLPERATPVSCDCLDDGTGYLTPKDIEEFDEAVDSYINGEMYKCVANGQEIVSVLTKLRDFRETELYLTVLNTLMTVLAEFSKDDLFGRACLTTARRPWGRDGEDVNVHVVSLHALLRDTPRNRFQPEGRPSILSVMDKRVTDTTFPFTIDLLKDSLRLFMSPYGQVAETEMFVYEACDCIDEKRRKPLFHVPCEKSSVVLVKTIFSEEEAERRAIEEKDFSMRFEQIDTDIRLWISTTEGKKELKAEIKKRKQVWSKDIKLRSEMYKNELGKANANVEEIEELKKRKIMFLDGLEFEEHELNSEEEADKLIKDQEALLAKQQKRNEKLFESRQKVIQLRSLDDQAAKRLASDDLVQKYCFQCYEVLVKEFRKLAIRSDMRRPWDGDDGADFEAVKNSLSALLFTAGDDVDLEKVCCLYVMSDSSHATIVLIKRYRTILCFAFFHNDA
jgi:Leucine-rich repeat (LRR) protein